MIRLTIAPGPQQRLLEFDADHVLVGRSPSNDVVIPDPRVSGVHGQVVRRSGGWYYQDLKSTNGSMVESGGERFVVDGRTFVERRLVSGDRLLLGDASNPVVIGIAVSDERGAARTGGGGETVVATRAINEFLVLSDALVADAPMVKGLFSLLTAIERQSDRREVRLHVLRFLLEQVEQAELAAILDRRGTETLWFLDESVARSAAGVPDRRDIPAQPLNNACGTREARLIDTCEAGIGSFLGLRPRTLALVPLSAGAGSVLALASGRDGLLPAPAHDLACVAAALMTGRIATLARAEELTRRGNRLEMENRRLRSLAGPAAAAEMIGESRAMKRLAHEIGIVAAGDLAVLILGETGTGKELVARSIHAAGPRADAPFAAVNCGALQPSLLESELFGHLKGSFTGAHEDKKGLFEVADGGTLLLDEIGEMPFGLQVKLLRVLQEGEIMPVGSTRPRKVSVRLLAATNTDLETAVRDGRFREDLFYRINTFTIGVPPLRERRDDIPMLAEAFLSRFQAEAGRQGRFGPGVLEALSRCDWPGNVRQLRNEVQRALLVAPPDRPIEIDHFSDRIRAQAGPAGRGQPTAPRGSLKEILQKYEIQVLRDLLIELSWNRSEAARQLGISRQALMTKLSRFNIRP